LRDRLTPNLKWPEDSVSKPLPSSSLQTIAFRIELLLRTIDKADGDAIITAAPLGFS
jgi:hypothetical protein